MSDQSEHSPDTARRPRAFRSGPWLAAAAALAFGGIALMLATAFLPIPHSTFVVGVLLFVAAAGPYGWAICRSLTITLEVGAERMLDADANANARETESLKAYSARLDELTRQIKAHTRAFKLEHVEEEVYSEILGINADDVAFMEWPEDGLRDSVHVYFVDRPSTTYPLTLDQMNQAAETINDRMDEHDREDGKP